MPTGINTLIVDASFNSEQEGRRSRSVSPTNLSGRVLFEAKPPEIPRHRSSHRRPSYNEENAARRRKEREEMARKQAAEKLAAEHAAKQKQLLIEEESCMRTSAEIYQLWCNLDEFLSHEQQGMCSTRTQYQKPQKPLLQYFRNAVKRVIDRNRIWTNQFHVQSRFCSTLTSTTKFEKSYKTRQDLLRNAQDNQIFWENIATACRQTALVSGPSLRSQVVPVVSKIPASPRDFSTLRQYAPKSWPETVRTAGGMRSCPDTTDGIRTSAQYESYLDMLLAEQDRKSAAKQNIDGIDVSSRRSRGLELQASFDFQPARIARSSGMQVKLEEITENFDISPAILQLTDMSCKSQHVDLSDTLLGSKVLRPMNVERTLSVSGGTQFGGISSRECSPAVSSDELLGNESPFHLPQISADLNGNASSRSSAIDNTARLPVVPNAMGTPRAKATGSFKSSETKRWEPRGRGVKDRKSLFKDRLPELAELEGGPMRRRGQARIWSEFSKDRILNEIGSDFPWESPEENELRPEVQYFRGCDALNIMPSKQTCLINRESETIDFHNAGLLDEQLRALGQSLSQQTPNVQVLDLSGNHLLTDSSLQVTLERFAAQSSRLRVLKLGGTQLGAGTVKVLGQAMMTRFSLEELSLQSVPLPDNAWPTFCNALLRAGLKTLDISDTQCGRWQQQACIQFALILTGTSSLRNVDISNNYFRKGGLEALGNAVSHPSFRLKVLSMSDNAWSDCEASFAGGNSTPMASFCERIRLNKTLRRLDLSRSQIDVMAAYCLEDAILGHPELRELDVQGNAFGEQGLRAILRSLLSSSSHLTNITVTEFRDMKVRPSVLFNYGDLTEDYTGPQALSLDSAYHRALLRLILRRTEDFQQPPVACLHGLKIDGQKCNTCPFKKEVTGLWTVPNSGRVEFSLVLDVPFVACSAQEFLLNWQSKRRVPVSVSKFMYLQRTWLSMRTDEERRLFVEALAKEVVLKLGHLKIIADEVKSTMPNLLSVVVSHLAIALPSLHRGCINSAILPSTSDYKHSKTSKCRARELRIDECYVIPIELRPRKEVMIWLKKLLNFNPSNPSGHYELFLAEPVDFTVMERILLVDSWATKVAEQSGLPYFSQTGTHSGIRNFTVNGLPVLFSAEWQLPGDGYSGEGNLCFDYVTPLRVGPDSEEMAGEVFDRFRTAFRPEIRDPVRMAVLSMTSHQVVLNAAQLFEILYSVKNLDFRRDLYCILFCRCVDYGPPLLDVHNGVLGDAPGQHLFSTEKRKEICRRLGRINTMDWHHVSDPPYNRFVLNMAFDDDRRIARLLIELSVIEPEINMVDTSWTGHSHTMNETGDGCIPTEWRVNPPDFGVFAFTYHVEKAHHARMQARFQFGCELGWQRGEALPEIPDPKGRKSRESYNSNSLRESRRASSRGYVSEQSTG